MSIYAVGDVQGCYDELQALLEQIAFDPANDTLWFCGDLVNRGYQSLETLRFVSSLGDRAVTVLGNHDLHLIATAAGLRKPGRNDTLQPVIDAPDCADLVDWLRTQPLLHHDDITGFTLVHAGLPPRWDLQQAIDRAREAEAVLRSDNYLDFIAHMYGNQPDQWLPSLRGHDRIRFIINSFTRLRFCTTDGRLDLKNNGAPGTQPDGLHPWFDIPDRHSRDLKIVFGHWSTVGKQPRHGVYPLDTGCLWGGELTALRIGRDPEYLRIDCPGQRKPADFL